MATQSIYALISETEKYVAIELYLQEYNAINNTVRSYKNTIILTTM